jgi:hypothetical protein
VDTRKTNQYNITQLSQLGQRNSSHHTRSEHSVTRQMTGDLNFRRHNKMISPLRSQMTKICSPSASSNDKDESYRMATACDDLGAEMVETFAGERATGYSPQENALISKTTWEKLSEKPWDMGTPFLKAAEPHLGKAHQHGSRWKPNARSYRSDLVNSF